MNWLRRHMAGRYGYDQLSMALLLSALLLQVIASLSSVGLLLYAAYIPLVISLYRAFSRQLGKRRQENDKFQLRIRPVRTFFVQRRERFRRRKTHAYFKCRTCRQTLRVPKGKGKIEITCPKCQTKVTRKT